MGLFLGSPAPVASSGWLVWVRFPGLGFCQWFGHPCACCSGALRAVRGFLPSGLFPFCWLLSGAPGFQSFFSFSSAQISLSALLAPASRPWGYSWLAPVSVLATFVARVVPRHLLVAYLLVSLLFCGVAFRFALSHLPGWVQLFCFPMAPFQSVLLVCPGCWLVFLALSSAFRQIIVCRLLRSLWFGWCFCYLPCGPTPGLSLAYWLFHRLFSRGSSLCAFLDSRLLYSLAGWLVLGSSFPVLVICSFLLSGVLAVASGSCLSAPLVCFLLLSTRGLSLVSVSWDDFSGHSVGYIPRFSLNFLALVSVGLRPGSVWSCYWSSCPIRCWGSRFSFPLAVFRF